MREQKLSLKQKEGKFIGTLCMFSSFDSALAGRSTKPHNFLNFNHIIGLGAIIRRSSGQCYVIRLLPGLALKCANSSTESIPHVLVRFGRFT